MSKKFICLLVSLIAFPQFIASEESVYFINIKDGDIVESPVFLQFGLSGKGVAPAGVAKENTGHHHLLINVDDLDLSKSIPSNENHLHFGGGQTEVTLELPPGKHTLQLVLGDWIHLPHDPPVISEKITITVKK